MVKAYLRYELSESFGVVTSGSALEGDSSGKLVISAANENLALWNLRQGTLVSHLRHSSIRALHVSCTDLPHDMHSAWKIN